MLSTRILSQVASRATAVLGTGFVSSKQLVFTEDQHHYGPVVEPKTADSMARMISKAPHTAIATSSVMRHCELKKGKQKLD